MLKNYQFLQTELLEKETQKLKLVLTLTAVSSIRYFTELIRKLLLREKSQDNINPSKLRKCNANKTAQIRAQISHSNTAEKLIKIICLILIHFIWSYKLLAFSNFSNFFITHLSTCRLSFQLLNTIFYPFSSPLQMRSSKFIKPKKFFFGQ